jgi:hypothetical protein
MKIKLLINRRCILKQHVMAGSQKHARFCGWKRLILIAGMLLPGGVFAILVPSQAAYAQAGAQSPFICQAGHGGNGGIANHGSSGANGTSGGGCVNGPRGGDAATGGQNDSPGGPGGNIL